MLKPWILWLTTAAVSDITVTSASSGGTITDEGSGTVIARGVCWIIPPNMTFAPTIADAKTIDGSGTGSFMSTITGLIPNTSYYVRAYATNNLGTGWRILSR